MAGATSPQLHLVETQAEPGSVGDAELVARAQGDSEAFAALYRRYIEPVYRYCYHRLSSHSAAEDATSDIFLKAFSGIRGYRNDRSFRSWLFAIAHNTVTDSYRSYHPQESIDAAARMFDPDPSPEDRAEFAEGERSAHVLLKQVTPQQGRILELRLAGLTGPEIAHVLDCSLASVKIGQVRGYNRLREFLGGSANKKEGSGHD